MSMTAVNGQASILAQCTLKENAQPKEVVQCAQKCAAAFVKAVLEEKEALANQIKTLAKNNNAINADFQIGYEQSLNNECLQDRRAFEEGFIGKVALGYLSCSAKKAAQQLQLLAQMQVMSDVAGSLMSGSQ